MKLRYLSVWTALIVALLYLGGCGESQQEKAARLSEEEIKNIDVPSFNQDSAYYFIQKQVDFGPRVPGTEAHRETADYLKKQLENYGAKVVTQDFEVTTFDNRTVPLTNIIGSFFPEKDRRILLAAHWDTRPFADKDSVRQFEPIDGANDGASGVGVLLEVARVLNSEKAPDVGIDIIFFDGEDWGNDTEYQGEVSLRDGWDSWWCLGSQYWSKNKHEPGYSAYYGILLDMVGAEGSQFRMEGGSMHFAPSVTRKIWNVAAQQGFSGYFSTKKEGGITDDHVYLNRDAKIPTVNIVHFDPEVGYFGHYHHTHRDNMDIISKQTLKAVGQTVLATLYYE